MSEPCPYCSTAKEEVVSPSCCETTPVESGCSPATSDANAADDCCADAPESKAADACCESQPTGEDAATPETASHSCCCRHKKRSPEEYKSLINRLSRIEGQIRGIRGMVEKDVYCADILVQVAAANSALNSFTKELLGQHIRTCVADDLREGSDEKLDELLKLLPKLMK